MRPSIGIDFGTTNTRLAYFDGRQVRLLTEPQSSSPFIPSAIAYQQGQPLASGGQAKERHGDMAITSLKWLLAEDKVIDVGHPRHGKEPIEVVTDYVGYLRQVLTDQRVDIKGLKVALTVPVNYPLKARRALLEAFNQGGLPIANLYPEPVAALYAVASIQHREGVSAIMDWGGGTLDLACLKVKDNKAYVLSSTGLKEGGDDFDEWIAREALEDFLRQHPKLEADRQLIWKNKNLGLRSRSEKRKCEYLNNPTLRWDNFVGQYDLEYRIETSRFEERLRSPVSKALRLFSQMIQESGESERLIEPVVLSGGTRNLDFIRCSFQNEFGQRLQDELPQADYFRDLERHRIDSATAIGAALLQAIDSHPVCSRAIGIRLADDRQTASTDLFWPIFKRGDKIDPISKVTMEFFVTNPSSGVARLLICDQLEPEIEPAGRLRKFFPVPIDRRESRIYLTFRITEGLLLEVTVQGALAKVDPVGSAFGT